MVYLFFKYINSDGDEEDGAMGQAADAPSTAQNPPQASNKGPEQAETGVALQSGLAGALAKVATPNPLASFPQGLPFKLDLPGAGNALTGSLSNLFRWSRRAAASEAERNGNAGETATEIQPEAQPSRRDRTAEASPSSGPSQANFPALYCKS